MLCVLYVIAVTTCLGIVGVLVERALGNGPPRRWSWFAIIVLSTAFPAIARYHHALSVPLGTMRTLPAHATIDAHESAVMGLTWWAGLAWTDPIINRVWLCASAALVVLGVTNAVRIAAALRARGERTVHLPAASGTPDVIVTDHMGPATVGVIRARVVVPRWVLAMPAAHRAYVLEHERQHRDANDARLLAIASLAVVLLPWNVAAWWQLRRLRLAVELDCDRRVVRALGHPDAYGMMLLRVAEAGSRGPRLHPGLLGAGALEPRLRALIAPVRRSGTARCVAAVAAALLLAIVLATPHPVPAHDDRDAAGGASARSVPYVEVHPS